MYREAYLSLFLILWVIFAYVGFKKNKPWFISIGGGLFASIVLVFICLVPNAAFSPSLKTLDELVAEKIAQDREARITAQSVDTSEKSESGVMFDEGYRLELNEIFKREWDGYILNWITKTSQNEVVLEADTGNSIIRIRRTSVLSSNLVTPSINHGITASKNCVRIFRPLVGEKGENKMADMLIDMAFDEEKDIMKKQQFGAYTLVLGKDSSGESYALNCTAIVND